MMKQRWSGLVPLVVILVGLSACESGLPTPHASPKAHASASTVAPTPDPQRCARLAKRGFTPCPPTADRLQLPPTTIRNATNGAVSDATAHQWAQAFQLTEAYYRWALQANARGALTSGVFADSTPNAIVNLFGPDLMDLDNAKAHSGQLVYEPLAMPSTQLVPIPAQLQQSMRGQGLTATDYGMAVRFTGPGRRSIRYDDGHETAIVSSGSDYSATLLIWGEFKADPDLGTIWYERGNYGCDGSVRSVCQL